MAVLLLLREGGMGSCVPLVEAVGVRSEDCMRQNSRTGIRNEADTKIHVMERERVKG